MSREISFEVPGLSLQGTYEIPSGAKPGTCPALLLLPGSGPTDRDGNSGLGIKTDLLKEIADTLAKQGVASFRFDKRAIRHYQAAWPKTLPELNKFFAWNNFVNDAKAGLRVLGEQPEVDPSRVGILGHSEGALIALQLGSDLAGKAGAPKVLVLLGGTGRPMGAILHEQIARQLKKNGASPEIAKVYLDYTDAACRSLAVGGPLPPNPPAGLGTLFNPASLDLIGAYCRIDPTRLAAKFSGPVLVINGERDTQVSALRDTPKLIAAFKARSSGSVDSLIAPNASHNLKSTSAGNDDAFDGPIVSGVLDKILAFVKKNL